MKLVSYDSGTLVALFSMEAFVPLRFTGQRALMELIGAVYNFAKRPALTDTVDQIQQKGLEYLNGELEADGEMIPVHRISIHNDGVVVAAPTTDDADRIFDHLQSWMKNEGAFRETPVSRLYLSHLVVDFEHSPQRLLKSFEKVLGIVTKHMVEDNRALSESGLSRIAFEFRGGANEHPAYVIERRLGAPLAQERYFCIAPLRTRHHVETLEAIEKLCA